MWSDFTGFTFDGVHSDELNIFRVSDGDRYNEILLPDIEDKTVEISGRDGVYYYGSFYKSRKIEIQIAFDRVTEEQYRNIRRLFGQKKICKLIFDERPYKVFYAKIDEPITLETVCFDEDEYYWDSTGHREKYHNGIYIPNSINHKVYTGNKRRIYKGEGSISFICYDPFARQLYKNLDKYRKFQIYNIQDGENPAKLKLYIIENGKYVLTTDVEPQEETVYYCDISNTNEWAASSGILDENTYEMGAFDVYRDISDPNHISFTEKYNGAINVYNPGDIDTPYSLFIPYVNNRIEPNDGDYVYISTDGFAELKIEPFDNKGGSQENGILVDTRAELIQGVHYDYTTKAWKLTGNVYNRYIIEGSFGRIFKGDRFTFRHQGVYLNCKVEGEQKPAIFYNYLYY